MVILQRYMIQEIIRTTLAVLMFLTLLTMGGRLIRYFGMAAQGGMDVGILFKLIGFQLPYLMELILPLSFFIGLMLVLGRLYVDQEMTVMRSAGISPRKLGMSLWPLVLAMVLIQAGLSVVGKPWGLYSAEKLKAEQAIRTAFDLIKPGEFISSQKYSVYVGGFSKDKRELLDVMVIERRADTRNTHAEKVQDQTPVAAVVNTKAQASAQAMKHNDVIIIAQRAIQVPEDEVQAQQALYQKAAQAEATDANIHAKSSAGGDANTKQVTMLDLYNGRRYHIGADNLAHNQIAFSQYRMTIEQPSKHSADNLEIEAQSSWSLWQRLPEKTAVAELGFRASLPFVMILALMLAVPLSKVNPRQGRWLKLIPSILLFATSVVTLMSVKGSVAKGKVSVLVYVLVLLIYAAFALYVYNKNKVHRRVMGVMTDVSHSMRKEG